MADKAGDSANTLAELMPYEIFEWASYVENRGYYDNSQYRRHKTLAHARNSVRSSPQLSRSKAASILIWDIELGTWKLYAILNIENHKWESVDYENKQES